MMHKEISPKGVFKPNAPTSLATLTKGDSVVHIGGQMPVNELGELVGKQDIEAQSIQVIKNMIAVVESEGGDAKDICRITVYLLDRRYLPKIMDVRKRFFKEPYPTTTVVVVAGLANPDWLVEIEGTAVLSNK